MAADDLLLYVRAATRWLAVIFIAVTLMVPVVILIDPRIELGTGREISVGQMVDNVTSLFGEADNQGLEGTKEFRLRWWSTIVGYTIGGPYFWTGKGYGINLADARRIPADRGPLVARAAQYPHRDPGPVGRAGAAALDPPAGRLRHLPAPFGRSRPGRGATRPGSRSWGSSSSTGWPRW